jgi:hypothetical protein
MPLVLLRRRLRKTAYGLECTPYSVALGVLPSYGIDEKMRSRGVHEHKVVFFCLFLLGLLLAIISQHLAGPKRSQLESNRSYQVPSILILSYYRLLRRSAAARSPNPLDSVTTAERGSSLLRRITRSAVRVSTEGAIKE